MKTRPSAAGLWRWWLVSMMAVAVFAMVNPLPTQANSSAQDQGWSQPYLLSPGTQSSWFPDVATDATGRVHAVWATSISTGVAQAYDVVMYSSSQDGLTWSAAKDIVALPSKGASTRPSLLADGLGWLHLTYRSYTVYYSQAPVAAVGAGSLATPQPISTPDNGYFSRLAIDKEGRLHLVYTENIQSLDCQGCFHIFYRQSDNNGAAWSRPVDISVVPAGAVKPQILIDEQDAIHVVWESGEGGDLGQLSGSAATQVMYTASYDRGRSWATPVQLAVFPNAAPTAAAAATATTVVSTTRSFATQIATPVGPTPQVTPVVRSFKNIALGSNSHGQLVMAWLSVPEDQAYYQVSNDQGHTWSDPKLIPAVWGAWAVYEGRTDDYAMATDSMGLVHLLMVGRTAEKQDTLSVLHLAWDGSAWSKPEAITTLAGDVPEWPRAAIGLGNQLHVVWYVRDEAHIFGGEGASQYRVWVSQKLLSAPAVAPVVLPTAQASPAPSAQPTEDLAATPAPTLAATIPLSLTQDSAPGPNLVYNESDYLRVVGQSIVPALVGVVLVVAAVRLFRR